MAPDTIDPHQLELTFPSQPLPASTYNGRDQADQNTDAVWKSCADRAIAELARTRSEFTAEDLAELIPAPDSPNRIGAAFGRAHRAGVIVPTGAARPSTTTTRRGGLVRVWRAA